jgi:methyltransferase (TIGR00027 family)
VVAAASRAAVLVCQGRAAAHGRLAPGRFADPTAMALLRAPERAVVERVRAGAGPPPWRERLEYELVRATAEIMVSRTVCIDDAVRAAGHDQVVILGAGLDGRAWRMGELAGADVFEVDQPASQQDKRARLGDLTARARAVRFVAVDFTRDDLGARLAAAGHVAGRATTWVWEGVIPYLTRRQVGATLAAVTARAAPGSRLVVDYRARSARVMAGRLAARALAAFAGRPTPWSGEPWRSWWTPESMRTLLSRDGFVVAADDDLLTLAAALGLEPRTRSSLRNAHVLVAAR